MYTHDDDSADGGGDVACGGDTGGGCILYGQERVSGCVYSQLLQLLHTYRGGFRRRRLKKKRDTCVPMSRVLFSGVWGRGSLSAQGLASVSGGGSLLAQGLASVSGVWGGGSLSAQGLASVSGGGSLLAQGLVSEGGSLSAHGLASVSGGGSLGLGSGAEDPCRQPRSGGEDPCLCVWGPKSRV